MWMKRLLLLSVLTELVTSLVLMIDPTLATRLLFNADLTPVGTVVARFVSVPLFSLVLACWPGEKTIQRNLPELRGMLSYNLLAAIYLAYVWLGLRMVGLLLIPAVLVHGAFTIVFFKMWFGK